ncbi:MAG: choice-of-anchor D domain-containing protein, partial [Verrucomicrobiae bacterium]|nr:choice-of-anchor D domain-containing protein [Verrucomicrobiae bacterium]
CSLFLYDSQNQSPGQHIASSGVVSTPRIESLLQTGTYYVRVAHWSSSATGAYRLVLKTQSSAIPITQLIQDNFDVRNDWEVYKFTLNSPGYVELLQIRPQVSTPLINLNITLRDEAGGYVFSGPDAAFLNPGTYFITVNSATNAPNTGDFSLKLFTPDNATAVKDGTISGRIDVPNDSDHFRFVVPGNAPKTVRFRISGSVNLRPVLMNESGQSPTRFDPSQSHDREVSLNPGVYFLYLFGYNSSGVGSYGNYTLNLSGLLPAAPEISIQQPAGTGLIDGKSSRKFETVVVGSSKGISRTFTIRNTGGKALSGIKVSIRGKDSGNFRFKSRPATTLAPGKQTTFRVQFKPVTKGKKAAWLHVTSNDADENPFDIRVTGKAVRK